MTRVGWVVLSLIAAAAALFAALLCSAPALPSSPASRRRARPPADRTR
ncbi:hypothetical protein [Sphingomonas bacterium]|nr:hypothetical protein [Sphingomonas bacterium]